MKTKITGIVLLFALIGIKASSQLRIDSIRTVNASSCSACNGSAKATLSGGFPPYTYYWSNGETSQKDTNLCPGTYYLFADDSHGDTTESVFTIGPATMTLGMSSSNTGCIGNTGVASVSVTGGTPPYTYLWSPGGGTTSSISALSAGTYTVSVRDAGGCTETSSVAVANATTIVFDSALVVTGATCSNNNGSAKVMVSGGTPPYTYLWTPSGGTSATATNLSAGTYTITVTDKNGCSGSEAIVVPSIGPVPSLRVAGDSCYGESNGSASVTSVSGGTGPYTYLWAPSGSTSSSISGLSSGSYTLTVVDKNGCTSTNTVYVYQPGPLTFVVDTMPDTGACNGQALIIVSGGTGPFTFTWSTTVNAKDTGNMQSVDSLCAGAYLVCITDANGCSNCDSVHVRLAKKVSGIAEIKGSSGEITVYPVPAKDQLIVAAAGMEPGSYSVYIYDMIGRQLLENDNMNISPGKSISLDVSGLPTGKYMLRISNGNVNKVAPFIIAR